MGENPLMNVQTEGQPAFDKDAENDNSDGSSPETNEADQAHASGEDKPADSTNKDGGSDQGKEKNAHIPLDRWNERESQWKERFNQQEQRHLSEITKFREEVDGKFASVSKPAGDNADNVPSWFGGDEPNWREYSAHTQQLVQTAVKEALSTIQKSSAEEHKAVEDATQWMRDQIDEIESDTKLNPEGQKVDRNKLMKFTLENEFIDLKTMKWDYKKAFKFMKPIDIFQMKKDLKDKKLNASATMSENRAEAKPSAFRTSKDFSNPSERPW